MIVGQALDFQFEDSHVQVFFCIQGAWQGREQQADEHAGKFGHEKEC
jgi:hypothetical protein